MTHNYINNEARDRVIGFLTAKYKLTDWLTLSGKANLDKTTDNGETSIYSRNNLVFEVRW
jgi:predicted porin